MFPLALATGLPSQSPGVVEVAAVAVDIYQLTASLVGIASTSEQQHI